MARIPKIEWGDAYGNTLEARAPLDNAAAYNEPREGSEWDIAPSGESDAWITGTDEFLAGDWRWIPTTDDTNPPATGWDGSTGFAAFLSWARGDKTFRFYPDKDVASYHEAKLVSPRKGRPQVEPETGEKRVRIVIRDVNGNAFTGY